MLLTVLLLCIGTTVVHGEARLTCQEGWFLADNRCYYFDRAEMSSADAKDVCRDLGANQAYPYKEEQTNFLKSTLKGMDTTGVVGAYLANKYRPDDGWDYDDDDYTDWADDPAPAGDDLCLIMSATKEWKWDAVDCYSEQDMIAICEMYAVLTDCYESTCFLVSDDDKCGTAGGYLAKIQSEEENNFVKQFLREVDNYYDVQIGGSDAGTEGTWVFADGEAMTFDDFDTNEPNNAGTNGEDCIVMDQNRDFKWIDYTCDYYKHDYLCEEPMPGVVG